MQKDYVYASGLGDSFASYLIALYLQWKTGSRLVVEPREPD